MSEKYFFFPAGHCVSAIMLAYFVLGAYLCIISLFSSPHNSKRDTGSLLMPQQMVKVCSIIIMLHKSYRSLFSVWFSLKVPKETQLSFSSYADAGSASSEDATANEWEISIVIYMVRISEGHDCQGMRSYYLSSALLRTWLLLLYQHRWWVFSVIC
jgi:hypothetical protein